MPVKKWLMGALLAAFLVATGCCRFCERCSPQVAQASPAGCCCTPCYSPGVAPVAPVPVATGWNQPAPVCPPCAR